MKKLSIKDLGFTEPSEVVMKIKLLLRKENIKPYDEVEISSDERHFKGAFLYDGWLEVIYDWCVIYAKSFDDCGLIEFKNIMVKTTKYIYHSNRVYK